MKRKCLHREMRLGVFTGAGRGLQRPMTIYRNNKSGLTFHFSSSNHRTGSSENGETGPYA